MGTVSYSFGPFYPVRKITSLLLLKPQKKYARVPSTLHDCLDEPEPRPIFCRAWLIAIFILSPLLFYLYTINGMLLHEQHGNILTTSRPPTNFDDKDNNSTSAEDFDATEAIVLDQSKYRYDKNVEKVTEVLPLDPPLCEHNVEHRPDNLTVDMNVGKDAAFATNPLIAAGGSFKPSKCQARHRIAIIVPYRKREKNLAIFLTHIHKFLIKQQIEYRIYVIEQSGVEKFNKGRLFNVGFHQAKGEWDCFVFHDVDLLPLDPWILYTCPTYPRLMSTTVYDGNKVLNFTQYFGGVTAMTEAHFVAVNGYSNRFWGWGGEDNDMFWRIKISNLPIMRYDKDIARYIMLPHERPLINTYRFETLNTYSKSLNWLRMDGISSLKYVVVFKKLYSLFTHIIADINPYHEHVNAISKENIV